MTRDNEQYAYLTVVGDFIPQAITAQIGLEPTDPWTKGERNEKTHMERKFSRWSLYSRLKHSASLEDHLQDVLAQVSSKAEHVRQVGAQYTTRVQLVGYFFKDYPGLCMDRELIAGLANLNVGIDVDFYYLYSEAREDS